MNSFLRNIKSLKLPASTSNKAYSAIAVETPKHPDATPSLPNSAKLDPCSSSIQAASYLTPKPTKTRKNTATFTVMVSRIRRNFSQKSFGKRQPRTTHLRRQVDKKDEDGARDKINERPCIKPINDRVAKRIGTILKLNENVRAKKEQKKLLETSCANKINYFFANHECKQCVSRNRKRLASFFEKNSSQFRKFGGSRLFSSCSNLHQKDLEEQFQSATSTAPYATVGGNGLPCKPNDSPVSLFDLVKLQSSRPKFQPVHRYKFESKTHHDVYEFDGDETSGKKKEKTGAEAEEAEQPCPRVRAKTDEVKDNETAAIKSHKPNDSREVYFIHPKDSLNQKICSALNTTPKVEISEKSKEMIARAIRQMIQPVIEKEFLKYDEVKRALDRMERNLESCLSKLNLHDEFSVRQLGARAIRDANRKPDVREPIKPSELRDPVKRNQNVIADITKNQEGHRKHRDSLSGLKDEELCGKPRDEGSEQHCQKDLEFKGAKPAERVETETSVAPKPNKVAAPNELPHKRVPSSSRKLGGWQTFDEKRAFPTRAAESTKETTDTDKPTNFFGSGKMSDVCMMIVRKQKGGKKAAPIVVTLARSQPNLGSFGIRPGSGAVSSDGSGQSGDGKGGMDCASFSIFGRGKGKKKNNAKNPSNPDGGSNPNPSAGGAKTKKIKPVVQNACVKGEQDGANAVNPDSCVPCQFEDYVGKCRPERKAASCSSQAARIPEQDADAYNCVKRKQAANGCEKPKAEEVARQKVKEDECRKPEGSSRDAKSQDRKSDKTLLDECKQKAREEAGSSSATTHVEAAKGPSNDCKQKARGEAGASSATKHAETAKDPSNDCKQKARDATSATKHAEAAKGPSNDCKQKARDASSAAKHAEAAKDPSNDCKQTARGKAGASSGTKHVEAAKVPSNDCKQKARDAGKVGTGKKKPDVAEVCREASKSFTPKTDCNANNISGEIEKLQQFCKNLKAPNAADCQQQSKSQTLNREDVCKQMKQDKAGTNEDKFEEICAKLREQSKKNDCTPGAQNKNEPPVSGKAGEEKSCSRDGLPKEGKSTETKQTSAQDAGCKNYASVAQNACQRLKEELAKGGGKRNVCGRTVDVKSDRKSKYDKYPWNEQCKKQPKECMLTRASEGTEEVEATKSESCVRSDKGGHNDGARQYTSNSKGEVGPGGKKCFGGSKSLVLYASREYSSKGKTLRYPWNQPKLLVENNPTTSAKFM